MLKTHLLFLNEFFILRRLLRVSYSGRVEIQDLKAV